jgi:hypothetical protein
LNLGNNLFLEQLAQTFSPELVGKTGSNVRVFFEPSSLWSEQKSGFLKQNP